MLYRYDGLLPKVYGAGHVWKPGVARELSDKTAPAVMQKLAAAGVFPVRSVKAAPAPAPAKPQDDYDTVEAPPEGFRRGGRHRKVSDGD